MLAPVFCKFPAFCEFQKLITMTKKPAIGFFSNPNKSNKILFFVLLECYPLCHSYRSFNSQKLCECKLELGVCLCLTQLDWWWRYIQNLLHKDQLHISAL
jgi:hypothetical protein